MAEQASILHELAGSMSQGALVMREALESALNV